MVVLEEGSMLTNGHNQYLQPDYLSPLPTTVRIVCTVLFPVFEFKLRIQTLLLLRKGRVGKKRQKMFMCRQ